MDNRWAAVAISMGLSAVTALTSCGVHPVSYEAYEGMTQSEALALGFEFALEFEGFDRSEVMVLSGTWMPDPGDLSRPPYLPELYRPREMPDSERMWFSEQDIPICEVAEPEAEGPCAELATSDRTILIASGVPTWHPEVEEIQVPVLYFSLGENGFWMRAMRLTVERIDTDDRTWRVVGHQESFSIN